MIAFVRGVIAASTSSGSMQKLSARMSTKHGPRAHLQDGAHRGVESEATVTTSSAGPYRAPAAGPQGHGVDGHEHGVAHAAIGRPGRLELARPLAHRQHAGPGGRRGRPAPRPARWRASRSGSRCRLHADGHAMLASMRYSTPHPRHRASPDASAATGTPLPSARRWPHAQTHPMRRAGLPATSAWSGTLRVTTAPAPTVANRPTSLPATTTAPAPIDAPVRRRSGSRSSRRHARAGHRP